MKQNKRIVQYLTAFAAALATVPQGTVIGWPTPVLPKFHNNETSIQITDLEMAWIVAMSSPGFIAGGLTSRFTLDMFGRKFTLLMSSVPHILGTIVGIFANAPWLLYVSQFLWGFGGGCVSVTANLYTAEIAEKDIRGSLTSISRFMLNFGILIVMLVGSLVTYKALYYFILVLPILSFLAISFIPESPYYYLKNGKVEKARKSLRTLRKYPDDEMLDDELMQLQIDVKKDMRRSGSAKELFTRKAYRKALIISGVLRITQLSTYTVRQYLGRIMQESKTTLKLSTVFIAFGGIRFLVSIVSTSLADRVGRRPLLICSYLGTAVTLFTVGLYFFFLDVIKLDADTLSPYGFITLTGIIATDVIATLGYQSIVQVIAAETFPLNVKAVATTFLSVYFGVLTFVMSLGYQFIKDYIGLFGVFWIFALVSTSAAIFTYTYVPETKGKSLGEIQEIFQGKEYNDESQTKLNKPIKEYDEPKKQ